MASKCGYAVLLVFVVGQHSRDIFLMKSLCSYLGCGQYYARGSKFGVFSCTKFAEIATKIIPFFRKYPILGKKSEDFARWCEIAGIIESKEHLTKEGLERIKVIQSGINKNKING